MRYEIVVRGLLSERLLAALPTLSAEAQGAETVLAGTLADQAALYGVIAQNRGARTRADRSSPNALLSQITRTV
jgi:hypothetical protein